jgi:hypothetical protein
MHTGSLDDAVTVEAPDSEQGHTTRSQDDPWFRAHTQVSQTLPRLREIATQVAVVGVLIAPITDSWGVRGC